MKDMLMELFANMEDNEIVCVWNEYCYECNLYDDEIFDGYRLEEMMTEDKNPLTWVNRFYFGSDDYSENGSANPNRNFFTFNGYGNIESFDYIYNGYSKEFNHIDIDGLIEYIIENDVDFGNDEIRDILDGATEEE